MAEWVERNTRELLGRRIAKKDAERLVDLVGADAAILYSELTKVDLFLSPGEAVTSDVIDSICGAVRQSTQFELAQAIGEKNMAKTLEIIETMYTGNVYLPLFVGAVFRHFWSLFKVFQFAKANPLLLKKYRSSARQQQNDAALALAVGGGVLAETQAQRLYPAVIKPRLIDQAVSFTESQYKRIFSQLAEFDTGIKTGKFDDSKTGFQVFCYKIAKGA
jgi:DNA polymerase III delta subunit